jgi:isoquinoline 1-oxidoreductase alpha subunit
LGDLLRACATPDNAGDPGWLKGEDAMAFAIKVNRKTYRIDADVDTPLLWVLRDSLGMTGMKFGCGMAARGACTVHVGGVATRSCITPVDNIGTSEITTIEAIGARAASAKIQKAWLDREVVQCGYCQSGQITSASALLASNPHPTDARLRRRDVRQHLPLRDLSAHP